MTNPTPNPETNRHLARLAHKLRGNAGYLSNVLFAYQQQEHLTDDALAHRLSLDPSQLPRLALCKRPQTDRFAEQVSQIAAYTGANEAALAQMIRHVDALQQLRTMPPIEESAAEPRVASAPISGLLAAARDHEKPADESEAEDQAAENDTTEL
jgi:hypothetical protein